MTPEQLQEILEWAPGGALLRGHIDVQAARIAELEVQNGQIQGALLNANDALEEGRRGLAGMFTASEVQATIDKLQAGFETEIAKAEADTRRLDWLEGKGFATITNSRVERYPGVHAWRRECGTVEWGWTAHWISSEYLTAREAIDAAMNAGKDGPK